MKLVGIDLSIALKQRKSVAQESSDFVRSHELRLVKERFQNFIFSGLAAFLFTACQMQDHGLLISIILGVVSWATLFSVLHTTSDRDSAAKGRWKAQVARSIENRNIAANAILERRPFILYLRDFGSEGPIPMGVAQDVHFVDPSFDEETLLGSVARGTCILAPVNIADQSAWSSNVEKILLLHDEWMSVVSTLIEHATLLVVWIRSPTPGIAFELREIVRKERQSSCIFLYDSELGAVTNEMMFMSKSCLGVFTTNIVDHMSHRSCAPDRASNMIGDLSVDFPRRSGRRKFDDGGILPVGVLSLGDILDQLSDVRATDDAICLFQSPKPS